MEIGDVHTYNYHGDEIIAHCDMTADHTYMGWFQYVDSRGDLIAPRWVVNMTGLWAYSDNDVWDYAWSQIIRLRLDGERRKGFLNGLEKIPI